MGKLETQESPWYGDVVKEMKEGQHGWGTTMEVMMEGPGWALQATIRI